MIFFFLTQRIFIPIKKKKRQFIFTVYLVLVSITDTGIAVSSHPHLEKARIFFASD